MKTARFTEFPEANDGHQARAALIAKQLEQPPVVFVGGEYFELGSGARIVNHRGLVYCPMANGGLMVATKFDNDWEYKVVKPPVVEREMGC